MGYRAVDIGRGLCRIIVRSRAVRKRFEDQPGIIVRDERVIFPAELANGMLKALRKRRRSAGPRDEQMEFTL